MRRHVVAAVLLAIARLAPCADGAPDPAFGTAGDGHFGAWFDHLPGGSAGESAEALVVHEGGAITVVGTFRKPGTLDSDCGILRARPHAAGYDTAFMPPLGYGPISLDLGGDNDDTCHAMLGLAGDEVLIAGGSGTLVPGERAGTLIKLAADGSRDVTFYDDGVFDTATDLGLREPGAAIAFRHIVASTGSRRILLAGNIVRDGGGSSRAVLLGLDGFAIDPTFNAGAALELGDGTLPSLELTAVAEDALLRMHVLATARDLRDTGLPTHGVLLRLRADGSADSAFGDAGRVRLPQCAYTGALAFDADGILVGCMPPNGGAQAGVLRLRADGGVDATFGVDGHAELRMEAADDSSGVGAGIGPPRALLSSSRDGSIVALGTYLVQRELVAAQGRTDLAVARLSADGRPDRGFGGAGRDGVRRGSAHYRFGMLVDRDARSETGTAMALDEDGGLLVVGARSRAGLPDASEFLVAKLVNRGNRIFSDGFASRTQQRPRRRRRVRTPD